MQMISKSSVVRVLLTTALGWVCTAGLAGCGQKGPLVLPAPANAASSPATGGSK